MKKTTFATAIVICVLGATLSAKTSLRSDSDRLKAEYIFIESERCSALGIDDGSDLVRRAFELTPDDEEIGFYHAMNILAVPNPDSTTIDTAKRLIHRMVEKHPENIHAMRIYAKLCGTLRDEEGVIWAVEKIDSFHPEDTDNSLALAEMYLNSPDTLRQTKGIAILDRVEETLQNYAVTTIPKINYYYRQGDTAAILSSVERMLQKAPDDAEAIVAAAKTYFVLSRNDVADSLYRRACAIEPPSGWAFYNYGQYLYQIGDTVGFHRETDNALRQDNLDVDIKLRLLRSSTQTLFADSTQYPRIESLFASMLEQHPHEAELHDLYASFLFSSRRFEEAAEQFSYVLDSDPSDVERWTSVMAIYNSADDYAKALEVSERALSYFPRESRIHFLRSGIFNIVEKYDEAISEMKKAIEYADTSNIELYSGYISGMGDIYQKIGNTDSACRYYDESLRVNPDNILALNNYAYYLSEIDRDLDKAQDMALKVINVEPDNSTYVDTYAWILYKKGEYFQAKQYIDKVLNNESYAPSAEVYDHAAAIYGKLGDEAKAAEFSEKASRARDKEAAEMKQTKDRMKKKAEKPVKQVKSAKPKSRKR